MNYMKQVAQMLGVELEEEFKIKEVKANSITEFTYKFTEKGLIRASDDVSLNTFYRELLNGQCEVIKLLKPILDGVEKEYLSHIIKPFKEKITFIMKTDYDNNKEYIFIEYYEESNIKYIIEFPSFKKGTMYKGMELDKQYTLEDLEL